MKKYLQLVQGVLVSCVFAHLHLLAIRIPLLVPQTGEICVTAADRQFNLTINNDNSKNKIMKKRQVIEIDSYIHMNKYKQ